MRALLLSLAVVAVALSGLGAACQNPTPAPPSPVPAPAPSPTKSPTQVYGELVEASCYAPNDSGLYWTTRELTQNPPSWATCLVEGGTVSACGVPCRPPVRP